MGIFRLKRKCFNRAFEELLKTPYKPEFSRDVVDNAIKTGEKMSPSEVFARSQSRATREAQAKAYEQLDSILNRFNERNKAIIAEGGTPRKLTEERLNKLVTAFNNKRNRVEKVSIKDLKKYVADGGIDFEKLTGTSLSQAAKDMSKGTKVIQKRNLDHKINEYRAMEEETFKGGAKSSNTTPVTETTPNTTPVTEAPKTGSVMETPVTETAPNTTTTPKTEPAPNTTPKVETPVTEAPKTGSVMETPVTETAPNNTPKTETTNTTPKTETTPNNTPKTETTPNNTPKTETTPNNTPKTETPNNTPKTNQHGTGGGKGAGTGAGKGAAETAGKGKMSFGKKALIGTAIAGIGALGYGLYKHNKNKGAQQPQQPQQQ